jgi:hypothetical protein
MIVKLQFFQQILRGVTTSGTALLLLGTMGMAPAAAALFDFNYNGTLTGADPLGTTATSEKVNGNFVLDADIPNTSSIPIAGRYDGAIRDLNLTFASTPERNAVKFNATDFPGGTNRLLIGSRGKTEELQVLFGNVASKSPFFQAPSLGIIFTSNDLTPTNALKEFLTPGSGKFDGQFKLTLSSSQASDPNKIFSGSFTITRVPEPGNITALVGVLLGLAYLSKSKMRGIRQ